MPTEQKRIKAKHLTAVQMIVLFYIGTVIISTLLLLMPISIKEGVELPIIDAMFVAVSAISVTGLSSVPIVDTFSVPGIFILTFELQLGGIGIMTLGTFIWILLGKKIGLKERQLIMTDQNRLTLSGLVLLMKEILGLIVLIEAVGTLILGVYMRKYFESYAESFYHGFFASVSATTNAGFDITGSSLIPFADDYFIQIVTMILIVLGAIGFPVLIEVKDYLFKYRKLKRKYNFSLFTKLTTTTFFLLMVIGAFFIFLFDQTHFFQDKTWMETFFYSLFQSVSTRSAGLVTMDMSEASLATQLWMSMLMFIGASPSSVGGGIRTTTFAIIVLAIFTFARGKSTIKIFRREILQDDIYKAFVVGSVAVMICSVALIILAMVENQPMIALLFEVCSAFGTNGMSLGITSELSVIGKVVLMALMFIGRIGILSLLFIIRGKGSKDYYHYPKEQVIIG